MIIHPISIVSVTSEHVYAHVVHANDVVSSCSSCIHLPSPVIRHSTYKDLLSLMAFLFLIIDVFIIVFITVVRFLIPIVVLFLLTILFIVIFNFNCWLLCRLLLSIFCRQ